MVYRRPPTATEPGRCPVSMQLPRWGGNVPFTETQGDVTPQCAATLPWATSSWPFRPRFVGNILLAKTEFWTPYLTGRDLSCVGHPGCRRRFAPALPWAMESCPAGARFADIVRCNFVQTSICISNVLITDITAGLSSRQSMRRLPLCRTLRRPQPVFRVCARWHRGWHRPHGG